MIDREMLKVSKRCRPRTEERSVALLTQTAPAENPRWQAEDLRVKGAWEEKNPDRNELELGPMSQNSVKFPSGSALSGWGAAGECRANGPAPTIPRGAFRRGGRPFSTKASVPSARAHQTRGLIFCVVHGTRVFRRGAR